MSADGKVDAKFLAEHLPAKEGGCALKGCEGAGTHRPVLLLFAKRSAYRGRREVPLRAYLGIRVCEAHTDAPAEDFISDRGWEQIVAGVVAAGLAPPERSRTRIEYQRDVEAS